MSGVSTQGVLIIAETRVRHSRRRIMQEQQTAEIACIPVSVLEIDHQTIQDKLQAIVTRALHCCLCILIVSPIVQRRLERLLWPKCCRPSPPICNPPNLCIITHPQSIDHALKEELRQFLWALRRLREPLYVVCVETRSGLSSACSPCADGSGIGADLCLMTEERGYDILPFIAALNFLRMMRAAPPFGRFVTKIHSKTDSAWRKALFRAACVVPGPLHDLVASRSCISHFVPLHDDVNTCKWLHLYRRGILQHAPQACHFVAGTVFTTRLVLLDALLSQESCLRQACTPAEEMVQGADGQTEHAIERYLGMLCTAGMGGMHCV